MQHNNLGVKYSTISFMMNVLDSRNGYLTYERVDDIVFRIKFDGSDTDYTFILEDGYITSATRVRELYQAFPQAQYIVLGGTWWSATDEAYDEADDLGVKILLFKDFLAALRKRRMT